MCSKLKVKISYFASDMLESVIESVSFTLYMTWFIICLGAAFSLVAGFVWVLLKVFNGI